MNDSMYEEYMRNVLGYQARNTYDDWGITNMTQMDTILMQELENCYPDIYRIIYPMVQRICEKNNRKTLTRELIDNMTNEIYFAIEDKEMIENREKEEKPENRQIVRNTNLNDLIRILILRELLWRPGGRPPYMRPPRPPMRPPMGPTPPRPQPRMGYFDNLYEY